MIGESLEFLRKKRFWASADKKPEAFARKLGQQAHDHPDWFWVASTGSSQAEIGAVKYVALDRAAFAEVIAKQCEFLDLRPSSTTKMLNVLPPTHIAYIAMRARALWSGAEYHEWQGSWSARSFVDLFVRENFSFSALVPAQAYDLLRCLHKGEKPRYEHKILVGGAAFASSLQEQARAKSWCLLSSYGATETGSAFAIQNPRDFAAGNEQMQPLGTFDYRQSPSGLLQVANSSLLKAYAYFSPTEERLLSVDRDLFDADGFFTTEDRVEWQGDYFLRVSRGLRFLVRLGENLFLDQLEDEYRRAGLTGDFVVLKDQEPRQGEVPILVFSPGEMPSIETLTEVMHKLSSLYRPQAYLSLPLLRSDTGKLLYGAMQDSLAAADPSHWRFFS